MDNKISKFKEDLLYIDELKFNIVEKLENLFQQNKNIKEKFIYGGIGMYLGTNLIGGIWVSRNHVSLVFGNGYKLEDKYQLLEGSGKFRRHIKLKSLDSIENYHCKEYINDLFDIEQREIIKQGI